MAEVLTEAWAKAWCDALNASERYRQAAASWEGAVVIAVRADAARGVPEGAVFLDLWHGACRGTHVAGAADIEAARFVITASAETWGQLLRGVLDPMFAVMNGALELTKGSVGSLFPQVAAAKELVAVARGLGGSFPATWPAA
jgi:putative sterol carrier protein